jgi:hypothetical protein
MAVTTPGYLQGAENAVAEAGGKNWSDYNDATRHSVLDMANQGITSVRYVSANGRVTNVPTDVAVRRAIRTEMTQAVNEQSVEDCKLGGINLVQVSSCANARESHAVWQGQVYQLDGSDKYPNYYSSCNVGDPVNGISGYNCDHVVGSYHESEGLRESSKNPLEGTGYTQEQARELTRQQRMLENDIRKLKRERAVGKELGIPTPKADGMLAKRTGQLKGLVSNNSAILRLDPERTRIYDRLFAKRGLTKTYSLAPGSTSRINAGLSSKTHPVNYHTVLMPKSIKRASSGTNPGYSTGAWGYTHNCQRCVPTYELRRRGYDVEALPRPRQGTTVDTGLEQFDGVPAGYEPLRGANAKTANQTIAEMLTEPDGARMAVFVRWKNSITGHTFIVEKTNGKLLYIDPQNNTMGSQVEDYFNLGSRYNYVRIDDKQLNPGYDYSLISKGK